LRKSSWIAGLTSTTRMRRLKAKLFHGRPYDLCDVIPRVKGRGPGAVHRSGRQAALHFLAASAPHAGRNRVPSFSGGKAWRNTFVKVLGAIPSVGRTRQRTCPPGGATVRVICLIPSVSRKACLACAKD
jgi:hypothetical protein